MLVSLTVHEWAHAWTADRLGDPTARLLGRVSFNPIVHIDPIGTILLPLVAMFSGFPILGWAKPVPVNTSQLRSPKRDFMIVAAAGPISNLIQAGIAAAAFHAVGGFAEAGQMGVARILLIAVSINLLLAVFNMIPIPPLDGHKILMGILPDFWRPVLAPLEQYGFPILLLLFFIGGQLGGSLVNGIMLPVRELVFSAANIGL